MPSSASELVAFAKLHPCPRSPRTKATQPGDMVYSSHLRASTVPGKTTQIDLLAAWLSERQIPHILTRQPGGTLIGDRIRQLLLDSRSTPITPHTELALMFADRAQAIREVIQPALAAGKLVLCDRFTDSTEAYQGGGRQLGSEIVLDLHRLICGPIKPDLTILLLPDFQASIIRAKRRNHLETLETGTDENRFEQESIDFFSRVHSSYLSIASREPLRVEKIDGELRIDQVHRIVIALLEQRLKGLAN